MRIFLLLASLISAGAALVCDSVGTVTSGVGAETCLNGHYSVSLVSGYDGTVTHAWSTTHPHAIMLNAASDSATLTVDRTGTGGCADSQAIVSLTLSQGAEEVVCQITVDAHDTVPPVLDFSGAEPSHATVEVDEVPTENVATALDACQGSVVVDYAQHLVDHDNALYALHRRWYAADRCGQADSRTQTVVVVDTKAPVIDSTLLQDVTVACDEDVDVCDAPVSDNSEFAGEVDYDPPVVVFTQNRESSVPASGCQSFSYTRTWTATDGSGNTAVHSQQVTLTDTEAPRLQFANGVPSDSTVECDSVPSNDSPSASDNCDRTPVITYDSDSIVTNGILTGLIRTWTATDNCGNTNNTTVTITVQDTEAPTISLSSDETLECGAHPPIPCYSAVTDNCDLEPSLSMIEAKEAMNCTSEYKLIHTYTATDVSGNSHVEVRTTTVIDTSIPTLDLAGGASSHYCARDPLIYPRTVVATDECAGNVTQGPLTVTPTETLLSGDTYNGVTKICYSTNDACGNYADVCETVTVHDTVAPVFTGVPADATVLCDAIPDVPTVTASDFCCGASAVTYNSTRFDGACADSFTLQRVWSTVDCAGNPASETQTITVIPAPITIEEPAHTTVEWDATLDRAAVIANLPALPAAYHNEGQVYETCTAHGLTRTATVGEAQCNDRTYEIYQTWTVTSDACFVAPITYTQTITVEDTTAGTFNGAVADRNNDCSPSGASLADWGVTAVDTPTNDAMTVQMSCGAPVVDANCNYKGSITCDFSIADGCGNNDSIQGVEYFDDIQPPVIDASDKSVTDNCETGLTSDYHTTNIDVSGQCEVSVTVHHWNIADDCGNSAAPVTETVVVYDTTPPEWTSTPSDVNLTCVDDVIPPLTNLAATDSEDPNFNGDVVGSSAILSSTQCGSQRVYSWGVQDCAGHSIEHEQTITVTEVADPAFSHAPMDMDYECQAVYDFTPIPLTFATGCTYVEVVTASKTLISGGQHFNDVNEYSWSAQDPSGCNSLTYTQTITVKDTIDPVPTISDSTNACNIDNKADPTVLDSCTSASCTMVDETTTRKNGDAVHSFFTVRNWECSDLAGNTVYPTQTHTAVDDTACAWDSTPAASISAHCEHTPDVLTCHDNCSPTVQRTAVHSQTGSVTGNNGVLINTWTTTDDSYNTDTFVQTVTVYDNSAPTIAKTTPAVTSFQCASDVTSFGDSTTNPFNANATDDCTLASFTMSHSDAVTTCADKMSREFTFVATDAGGLTTTETATITANDDTAPVFTATFADASVTWGDANIATMFGPDNITAAASDNCGAATSATCNMVPTLTQCLNTYVWSCQVCDECDNCKDLPNIFTVTEADDRSVTLDSKPDDIHVMCNHFSDPSQFVPAQATIGNSVGTSVVPSSSWKNAVENGHYGCNEMVYEWTTTHCGKSDSHQQTVRISDVSAPQDFENIPADWVDVDCQDEATYLPAHGTPTATDACSGTLSATVVDNFVEDGAPCVGCTPCRNYTRTVTSTDNCGNNRSKNYRFRMCDETAPTFSPAIEADVTVEAGNPIPVFATRTASDNCVGYSESTDEVKTDGSCTYDYTLTRYWNATDAVGHTTLEARVVTVQDTLPPIFAGLPDAFTQISYEDWDNDALGWKVKAAVTANDKASGDITPTFSEYKQDDLGVNNFTMFRTWTAADDCGHSATFEQTISVVESHFCEPEDTQYNCHAAAFFDTTAFALECQGQLHDDVTVVVTSRDIDQDPDDGSCSEKLIEHSYTISDGGGDSVTVLQTLTIVDLQDPTWTSEENSDRTTTLTKDVCSRPAMPVKVAADNCGATPVVTTTSTSNDAHHIEYEYTATDDCGRTSTTKHTDHTVDNIFPEWDVASLPLHSTSNTICEEPPDSSDPICSAFCATEFPSRTATVSRLADITVSDDGCEVTKMRRWKCTDGVHSIYHNHTITWRDDVTPQITTGDDVTCDCNDVCTPTATYSDQPGCAQFNLGAPTSVVTDLGTSVQTVYTWTQSDLCGNVATGTQTITFIKNVPPTISLANVEISQPCVESDTFPESYSDDCDLSSALTIHDPVDVNDPGTDCVNDDELYTVFRTFSVTDTDGLSTSKEQTIHVVDTDAPVLTERSGVIAASYSEECGGDVRSFTVDMTDNCEADALDIAYTRVELPKSDITSTPEQLGSPNTEHYTLTWSHVDTCGHSVAESTTIAIVDTTAPVLDNPPNNVDLVCSQDIPNAPDVTYTDNCDASGTAAMVESTIRPACDPLGLSIQRVFTATDSSGNSVTHTQTINRAPQTAPVCNIDVPSTEEECPNPLTDAIVTCTDPCGGAPLDAVMVETSNYDLCGTGRGVRTYTATEPTCSLTTVKTQDRKMNDITPPSFSDVPTASTGATACDLPSVTPPTCSDACSGPASVDGGVPTSLGRTVGVCEEDFEYTWTCSDDCGRTNGVSATMTIEDTTAPVIIGAPTDENVNRDCSLPAATYTVTASDDCTRYADELVQPTPESSTIPGAADSNLLRKEVTKWTATSWCGQISSVSQTVSVIDDTPPTLHGVFTDVTLACGASANLTVWATDDCATGLSVVAADPVVSDSCGGTSTTVYSWSVSDTHGNSASESRTVTIADMQIPELSFSKDVVDASVECHETYSPAVCSATDDCTAAPTCDATWSEVLDAASEAATGSYQKVITYAASDECGNLSEHFQTITFNDIAPPVISNKNGDETVDCTAPAFSNWPTSADVCDPAPVVVISNTTTSSCVGQETITYTYTVTDRAGLTASHTWTQTRVDTTGPTLSFDHSLITQNAACNETLTWPVASCSDNCGDCTVSSVDVNTPSCAHSWQDDRTYTATDSCGNIGEVKMYSQIFSDDEAPVINSQNAAAATTISAGAAFPAMPAVTAFDICSGDLTANITFTEVVTGDACNAVHTRSWSVSDDCGHNSQWDQVITVEEDTPVTCTAQAALSVECGQSVTEWFGGVPSAVCSDRQGRFLAATHSIVDVSTDPSCGCIQVKKIVWAATDSCGNFGTAETTVTVSDTVPPVISCSPAHTDFECAADSAAYVASLDNLTWTDASIVGNQDATLVAQSVGDACAGLLNIRTWTATDCSGNSATVDHTINVHDTSAPKFNRMPEDITLECGCDTVPSKDDVQLQLLDNCDGSVTVDVVETGAVTATGGALTRVYSGSDACGNPNSFTQVLTVQDTTPPVLVGCPANNTISCETYTASLPVVHVADECDASLTDLDVVFSETKVATCANSYTLTRTWTATDAAGNVGTQQALLHVLDTDAPTLVEVQPICLYPADEFAYFTLDDLFPTVDNCDDVPEVDFVSCNSTSATGCYYDNADGVYVKGQASELYTLYVTLTDACSQSTTVSRTISVAGTEIAGAQGGCVQPDQTYSP